jgi:hypothetical protein
MKIICTQEEYDALQLQFQLGHCPFLYVASTIRGDWECSSNCEKCTKEHIQWEIRQKNPKAEFKPECKNCYWVDEFGDRCICRTSLRYGEKVVQWGETYKESKSLSNKCDKWKMNED